ncbi:hypothetical protein KZ820_14310 [Sphingomonas sp. RRHST34]|uniref:Uncharacterized protein n=1 Tax=Sphingomonas citri TaxID=2862499 RepID=A0ABS7BQQ8_9SPHN|nr:hypothetical protein [Sphingomonas citri]MBW6531911.1 hypothetical protein [Sphingomonas citri]
MATQLFQPRYGSPAWLHEMIASSQEPTLRIVDASPPLAKALLDLNGGNRSVRTTKVAQYAADMAAKQWTLNGEPIIISKDGQLNDGQHRCLAIIDANTTVQLALMFGIERETRLTVDQGSARSAGDFLAMEGVVNASAVAAIARMVLAYERAQGAGLTGHQYITSAEVRARVATDKDLAEAATFGHTNSGYSRSFAAGSLIGFAYYELARVNRQLAHDFLERVCRGDNLAIGSPAHTLREKLIAAGRTPRDRKLAMIFKAWNFYRRGLKKVSTNTLNSTLPFPALL